MHSVISYSQLLPTHCSPVLLTRIDGTVRAGFPSPAADFACAPMDIASMLIRHPQATFLIRARGMSMRDAGINDDDVLVVDRAIQPQHGNIVCAVVDTEFTIKYLHRKHGKFRLVAANRTFPDIVPRDGQTVEVWGVVTASITRHLKV